MRILHTADWHLGNTFHGHSRTGDHRHFLSWLLGVIDQNRPDALIVSGDIFDNANPAATAEHLFYDFLDDATAHAPQMQTVIIAGNHDGAARLEAPADLLRRHNVYLRGTIRRTADGEVDFDHYILPLCHADGDSEARVVCLAVPFLRPADYPQGLTPGAGMAWFMSHLKRRLAGSPFAALPIVTAAHFYAAGAEVCENEHSERLVVGGQECISLDQAACGAVYTALGHLHKAQRVGQGQQAVHYAGSALPMSFAEKNYRHGVNMVSIEADGACRVERIEYHPQRLLMSIPTRGAALPADVLAGIQRLPERTADDDGQTWPYLEIRVHEQQPQPTLMREVREALATRAALFCRMVREGAPLTDDDDAADDGYGLPQRLEQLTPEDLAQHVFRQRYSQPMPEPMRNRLTKAYERAVHDGDDSLDSTPDISL